jgi:hypothetical protein
MAGCTLKGAARPSTCSSFQNLGGSVARWASGGVRLPAKPAAGAAADAMPAEGGQGQGRAVVPGGPAAIAAATLPPGQAAALPPPGVPSSPAPPLPAAMCSPALTARQLPRRQGPFVPSRRLAPWAAQQGRHPAAAGPSRPQGPAAVVGSAGARPQHAERLHQKAALLHLHQAAAGRKLGKMQRGLPGAGSQEAAGQNAMRAARSRQGQAARQAGGQQLLPAALQPAQLPPLPTTSSPPPLPMTSCRHAPTSSLTRMTAMSMRSMKASAKPHASASGLSQLRSPQAPPKSTCRAARLGSG